MIPPYRARIEHLFSTCSAHPYGWTGAEQVLYKCSTRALQG